MVQFARPNSDVATGSWTSTPLWQKVDEATRSDADFISSANNTVGDTCELSLSALSDPALSTGHVLRYAYRKSAAAGHSINIRVRLLQGATEIASYTHTAISETFTQADQTLSGSQADAITDYASLRVEFQRNGATGGSPGGRRSAQVSWVEFEAPVAPTVVSVGQAFSSNTAFACRRVKAAHVGQAAEADIALPAPPARAALVGQAGAADAGLALSHSKAVQISRGGEIATGLVLTPARLLAVNLSLETEVSLPSIAILGGQNVAVGAAVGTDSGLAIASARARALGHAMETNTSHPASARRWHSVGQSSGANTAHSVMPVTPTVFVAGLAIDLDTALAISPAHGLAVGPAIETDSGFATVIFRTLTAGQATQSANAFAVMHRKAVTAGLANETELAFALLSQAGDGAIAPTALAGSFHTEVVLRGENRLGYGLAARHTTDTTAKGEVDTT